MKLDDRKSVYTDQQQCEKFNADYWEPAATLVVHTEALLKSKRMGYDAEMTALIESYGDKTLVLVRRKDQGPGWWQITEVV